MSEITESKTTKKDVKEKMVKVMIPRERDDNSDVYVSINNQNWLIQRGKYVEVPECVAKVLEDSQRLKEEAYERQEQYRK